MNFLVYSQLFSSDVDAGEVERLKSQKLQLDEAISTLEDNLRAVKSELRNIEDEGAKLEKQRVGDLYMHSMHIYMCVCVYFFWFLEVVLHARMCKFTLEYLYGMLFPFFFWSCRKGACAS